MARPPLKIIELNRWLKETAAANGYVYLDYFGAMVDETGLLKRELADDGLHPNEFGYAVMAPLAQAAISSALARPEISLQMKALAQRLRGGLQDGLRQRGVGVDRGEDVVRGGLGGHGQ